MLGFIKKALGYIDTAADKIADLLVSKPKLKEDSSNGKALAATAGAAGSAATVEGVLAASIYGTEALCAAGASATAVQAAATVAAASTEIATVGAGTSSVAGACSTIAGSGSAPLIAAGAAVLFTAYTGGKICYRAAGHAYNYISSYDENTAEQVAQAAKGQIPSKPTLTL